QRPPPGNAVVPQVAREIGVDPALNVVDALEEAPREQRDEQPDHRGKHQQHAVLPAPKQRARIERRSGDLSHTLGPPGQSTRIQTASVRSATPTNRRMHTSCLGGKPYKRSAARPGAT